MPKWLILGLRQGKYEPGAYCSIIKEVLKKKKDVTCQRDTETNPKKLPMAKLEQCKQQDKHNVALDYNPKYDINICKSIPYK